jgi:hypothetical protein
MGLRRFLAAEDFDHKFRGAPIIAQFSSMGSLTQNWLQEFTQSLSAGRIADAGPRGAPPHRQQIARHSQRCRQATWHCETNASQRLVALLCLSRALTFA